MLPRSWSRSLAAVVLFGSLPAWAQQGELSGRFSLGARGVDIGGARNKYREDINLDDGPRIFDLGFVYQPAGAERRVDRIDLDITSLGGEPYESMRLELRKYGSYRLKLDRRVSEYFYEDVVLPVALASVSGSTAGDFHHFDFERVRDRAELDLRLTPATKLNVDLERTTKTGESTTTLDIERDEFELHQPIDESFGSFSVGIEHDWDRLRLVAEQRIGDYENVSELFLPGFSRGENTANLAELDFFNAEQPYDYESLAHSFRLLARPTARLDVQGGWRREDLDLSLVLDQSSQGLTFTGAPYARELEGAGTLGRDIELVDVELGFEIGARLRLVTAAQRTTLDQRGDLGYGGELGASDWAIETDGLEARVDIAAAPSIVVGVGWSTEQRDVGYVQSLDGSSQGTALGTGRDGFFLSLAFDPAGPLSLTASIEDNSIDDPFSLSAPTERRRYRAQVRYRWARGLTLSTSLRRNDLGNDLSGWNGDTTQADLRLGYMQDGLQFSAGYGRIDFRRSIAQLVAGGTRADLFAIAYESEAEFVDASLRWQLRPAIALGGHLRAYDNHGSYPLERDDWRAFVEVGFGQGYHVRIAEQRIDYREDGFDDFDAKLFELGIGYRW